MIDIANGILTLFQIIFGSASMCLKPSHYLYFADNSSNNSGASKNTQTGRMISFRGWMQL
jgi:hypothetical protein